MKVLAINGSPRKDGNTAAMIRHVCDELEKEKIETETLHLRKSRIRGCIACYKCFEKQNRRCGVEKDDANFLIGKMDEADGIIMASPTYFADITSELKALIDRSGMVAKANADMFRRKVGAGIVAARRAGEIHAFNSINHFFLIGQMIIPGSSYWNCGFGLEKGEVENDREAVQTMRVLGQNTAWLLKKLHG